MVRMILVMPVLFAACGHDAPSDEGGGGHGGTAGAGGEGGEGGARLCGVDGARCGAACLCSPCDAAATDCHAGICLQDVCEQRVKVRCQLPDMSIIAGCDGRLQLGTTISWDGGACRGASTDVGYCAPGAQCAVTTRTQTRAGLCL